MTTTLLAPDAFVTLAQLDADAQASHPALADRPWAYVGAAVVQHAQLRDALGDAADDAIARLTERTQWLSALSGDIAPYETADGVVADPLLAGLRHACDRLGEDAVLLTEDESLLAAIPQAARLSDCRPDDTAKPLDFLDLKTQQRLIRDEIETRLTQVLHHGRYVLGPEMVEMETRLAEYVGVEHCISVASGTDALVIALMALEIGPGDEVITTPYTWISTAEAVSLVGATPVFVDIDEQTFNIDPGLIEAAITPRTKAIMPVSLYGQCAETETINAIAEAHGLPVIEDAAQSFGATRHGGRSGGLTTIGTTSFFPSKPLGGYGDGGATFTNDAALAERMQQIRVHGQKKKHEHPILGLNGRMDTMQAAVVLAKLGLFDDECKARRTVAARYEHLFREAGLDGIACPAIAAGNESVYAQYTIRCEQPDSLRDGLASEGIPSVSYYIVPVPFQAVYAELGHRPGDFPVCERVAVQCLSLPMSPYLDAADQRRVVDAIAAVQQARGSFRQAA